MQSIAERNTLITPSIDHNNAIADAWKTIAPCWPLRNSIACNPLQGLEDLPFEQAISLGESYFKPHSLPLEFEAINRETIKWCQAFFDEGQATIHMPFKKQGLYHAWRKLAPFDQHIHRANQKTNQWLLNLPLSAEETIAKCMQTLNIPNHKKSLFYTLILTTLPGWASYVKYQAAWADKNDSLATASIQTDYLAMRLVITSIIWPNARDLLSIHQKTSSLSTPIENIRHAEKNYQRSLLNALSKPRHPTKTQNTLPIAQLVFCIDVRSEPIRRALEAQGHYETFGFAGFFGIPVKIHNELSDSHYASCPVLIKPKHLVKEIVSSPIKSHIQQINRLYSALKYSFTTPFVLAEAIGPWSGLWMTLKTIFPHYTNTLKQRILNQKTILNKQQYLRDIDFNDQCVYAENALRMMGFTDHFSELVVLCGHGSKTENNAYASALDCGACGGHSGHTNARILAEILNDQNVRTYLKTKAIFIPDNTHFIAALHNTTTDDVTLDANDHVKQLANFTQLTIDIKKARHENNQWRCKQMGYTQGNHPQHVNHRSHNWSETRPEWGLARNAAFIVGQRSLTQSINLEGRVFLHSYDWRQDNDGRLLTTILTAPMIVAQWINSQYLFSSLDNIAYGGGSKITQNITSKIGIMQGNASDLMHGLPLQSVHKNDRETYHEPMRLTTVVHAPRRSISAIISNQRVLQKLFGNSWVLLYCLEPTDGCIYELQRDFTWKKTEYRHHV